MSIFSGLKDVFTQYSGEIPNAIEGFTGQAGADAARDAAAAQERSAAQAIAEQRYEFDKALELTAPWRTAGVNALTQYQNALTGTGMPQAFRDFTQTPAYQFPLQEGLKGVERSASARGGILSGRTLKATTRYGQDYASGQYQNYLGQLSNLSGLGYTGSAQQGQNAITTGANVGNLLTGAGNARASGYINAANAQGQGAQNVASIAAIIASLFA